MTDDHFNQALLDAQQRAINMTSEDRINQLAQDLDTAISERDEARKLAEEWRDVWAHEMDNYPDISAAWKRDKFPWEVE